MSVSSREDTSLNQLQRNKRFAERQIRNAKNTIESAFRENASEEALHRIAASLETWKLSMLELKDLIDEILEKTITEDLTTEQISTLEDNAAKEYYEFQVSYDTFKGKLSAMKSQLQKLAEPSTRLSLNASTLGNPPSNVKLPDIQVPKFDGQYENFTEWYALFCATIHNNDAIDPVRKLYHLKEALIEDAKYVLKDFSLQEGMYDAAFKHVEERYFNKRALITRHFHNLKELPNITNATLRESIDKVNAIIRGLEVCKIDVAKMSPLITFLVVQKLPDRLRNDWENSLSDNSTYPSFNPLAKFLQNRCFAFESFQTQKNLPRNPSSSKGQAGDEKGKKAAFTVAKNVTPSINCLLCEKNHYISNCDQFLDKTVSDRIEFARQKKLCLNCLRKNHTAIECNSSRCRKCGRKHHTTLHLENLRAANASKKSETHEEKTVVAMAASVKQNMEQIVLLPSAVVLVKIKNKFVKARVLIDPCSQANLVAENFVRKNKISTHSSSSTIQSITPGDLEAKSSVSINLKSRQNDFQLQVHANVVGRIPYSVSEDVIKIVKKLDPNLFLADYSLTSSDVDILVGGEHSHHILLGNKKFFGDFCLEESQFGWVTEGPLNKNLAISPLCCYLIAKVERDVNRFFEIEEVYPPNPVLSEHELCEAHFESTIERLSDGRFQAKLPWKKTKSSLADTYKQARASLLRFEKVLDADTRSMYVDFMTEYRNLDHMQLASNKDSPRYFIPHLFVMRPGSSTTKFRTVFNASAKNTSGVSLNQALMTGPKLQPDLFETLIGFRRYEVAFAADITKMYRCISIHPDDRPFQSILWRDQLSEPMKIYELTTVSYGTAPASYIATKCLEVLAKEIKTDFPEASRAISSEFYMDDLMTGADSIQTAIKKGQVIHSHLEKAHFSLRKYVSNSPEFLASLDPSLVEPLRQVKFSEAGAAKLLGLQWVPAEDYFTIAVNPIDITNVVITKRIVASLIASTFDPLGIAAPIVIRAKILLQDIWREGKDWNDPVSEKSEALFRKYHQDTLSLSRLRIPRSYSCSEGIQIVGFSDASLLAYGAAIYIRVRNKSVLVCSKSKVAPLKKISIPRLEILGAVLLTQLLNRVCKFLKYPLASVTAFCDSEVVLAWIKGPGSKFETFIRNRVDFINSLIPFDQWHYVNTKENPADLLTRPNISVDSLINNPLWIRGPEWLCNEVMEFQPVSLPVNPPETRKVCNVLVKDFKFDESLVARYSNLDKLVRVVCLVWKFITRLNTTNVTKFNDLNSQTRGLYLICRISQNVCFRPEILALKKNEPLSKKSPLDALNPFIDTFGLLRVGGRLRRSNLPYDTRHPIIISQQSLFATLLVRNVHEKYYHAYRSFTLAFIQSRFWIVGGAARLVKKIIRNCVFCTRLRKETQSQIMGDLPSERTIISRPFTNIGVDLAGPFNIRCTNHRSQKILKYYAAFFVCFSIRAVHIEHVSNLTTSSFIAALQRFTARRGIPSCIWSDNGTNFQGANNFLQNSCESLGIGWKFIPAKSPHQGGIWESSVKAGKKHLDAASKGHTFNLEQFITVLSVVESIMNSRPLYRKREVEDPDIIDILTPGHFLVGSHLLRPEPVETHAISLTERSEIQQIVLSSFWRLWSRSYLAQLQTRSKWKKECPNLEVGDVVIIKDECHPLKWKLARVSKVMPDAFDKVRVVEIVADGSTYTRSVQNLVKLPVEES